MRPSSTATAWMLTLFMVAGATKANAASPQGEYLWSLGGQSGRVQYSPDGSKLAVARIYGFVEIYEASTMRQLRTIVPSVESCLSVAFTADGKKLAIGSADQMARVFDASTGRLLHSLPHPGDVRSVSFSPDGSRLAVGGGSPSLAVWHLASNSVAYTATGIRALFSPDGQVLATTYGNTVFLFEASTGTFVSALNGHTSEVVCLDFTDDGQTLATGAEDQTVRFWDIPSKAFFRRFVGYPSEVRSLDIDPSGTLLSSTSGNSLVVWNLQSGTILYNVDIPQRADSSSFSSDGTKLAVTGFSTGVTVRESTAGSVLWEGDCLERGWHAAYRPNGETIAWSNNSNLVHFTDARTGKVTSSIIYTGTIGHISYSRDGQYFLAVSNNLRIYNASTFQLIQTISVQGATSCAPFSDTELTAVSSSTGNVYVCDTFGGTIVRTYLNHSGPANCVAVTRNDEYFASGGDNGSVIVREGNGTFKHAFHNLGSRVTSVDFSNDASRLTARTENGTIYVWSMLDGSLVATFNGQLGGTGNVDFSDDGTMVVSCGYDLVQVWNLAAPAIQKTYGPLIRLRTAKFTPGRKTLAIAAGSIGVTGSLRLATSP